MHSRINDQKIKTISDILLKQATSDISNLFDLLEEIDDIVFSWFPNFVTINKVQTKKNERYYVESEIIGTVGFRIKKDHAKKIGLYPYHKNEYQIRVYKYYIKEKNLPRLENNEERSLKDSLSHIKIRFNYINTIKKQKKKKFEMFRFIKYIYKLNHNNKFKIEKHLLDLL